MISLRSPNAAHEECAQKSEIIVYNKIDRVDRDTFVMALALDDNHFLLNNSKMY